MIATMVTDLHQAGIRRVSAQEPMARHTSWRIGGPADILVVADSPGAMATAIAVARRHDCPWIVIGGGNNILVADAGIDGLVILNRLRGIDIEMSSTEPTVRCGAGVFFAKIAQFTARHGFTGMEWGIAIPGTVGGGIINNAGAHWSDVSRSLVSASVLDPQGRMQTLSLVDLEYRYRHSAFKAAHTTRSQIVITEGRFRLAPDEPDAALARVEDLRQHRLRTQPVKEASAGSTFKNPANDHAGALVDRAGLKGHRVGGAQISPLHANFILNVGGASAHDVLELIRLAQARVAQLFGVRLEPEVQFVGRWQPSELCGIVGEVA